MRLMAGRVIKLCVDKVNHSGGIVARSLGRIIAFAAEFSGSFDIRECSLPTMS